MIRSRQNAEILFLTLSVSNDEYNREKVFPVVVSFRSKRNYTTRDA